MLLASDPLFHEWSILSVLVYSLLDWTILPFGYCSVELCMSLWKSNSRFIQSWSWFTIVINCARRKWVCLVFLNEGWLEKWNLFVWTRNVVDLEAGSFCLSCPILEFIENVWTCVWPYWNWLRMVGLLFESIQDPIGFIILNVNGQNLRVLNSWKLHQHVFCRRAIDWASFSLSLLCLWVSFGDESLVPSRKSFVAGWDWCVRVGWHLLL